MYSVEEPVISPRGSESETHFYSLHHMFPFVSQSNNSNVLSCVLLILHEIRKNESFF